MNDCAIPNCPCKKRGELTREEVFEFEANHPPLVGNRGAARVVSNLHKQIADLQSQLAEERQRMAMLAGDECDGAQIEGNPEWNKRVVALGDTIRKLAGVDDSWWDRKFAEERAKRGELIERAKQTICGYCNPERLLNLVGHFDESGKNHVDSSGCIYPCKAYPLRALDPSASQAFEAMQQREQKLRDRERSIVRQAFMQGFSHGHQNYPPSEETISQIIALAESAKETTK